MHHGSKANLNLNLVHISGHVDIGVRVDLQSVYIAESAAGLEAFSATAPVSELQI